MKENERSQILGTMKMSRLVPKVAVPIMISLLVQALYNVVDSIFVARYNSQSLTAVSLAFPIQMLMIAVSTGLGTGINSLTSRRLGEKNSLGAKHTAGNGIFLMILGYFIFLIFGLFFVKGTFSFVTADKTLRILGTQYLEIVCIYSFGLFLSITFERLMQATGNTILSMIVQLTGAIVNMILDPIMIFGYLGCPELGIRGAAIATVIGQCASMTVAFTLNQLKNKELRMKLKYIRPRFSIIKNILGVGIPSVIMQSIGSAMNMCFNFILMGFGDVKGAVAVSVLGIYFKLQSFIFMPVFGLSSSLIPIIGYNYGAKNKDRVYSAIKTALIWAICIMVFGTVLFMSVPEVLLSMFETKGAGEITAIGVVALRTICIHFVLAAIGITLSTVFQAVGKGVYSMIMSICRQLLVLIPAAWILARVGGLNSVWWSFVVAEFVSLIICLGMYHKVNRRIFKWM